MVPAWKRIRIILDDLLSLSCTASPKIGLYSPRRTGIDAAVSRRSRRIIFYLLTLLMLGPSNPSTAAPLVSEAAVSTHRRIQRDASNGVNWNDSTGHPDFCETVRIRSSHARPKLQRRAGVCLDLLTSLKESPRRSVPSTLAARKLSLAICRAETAGGFGLITRTNKGEISTFVTS